jgi:hypothetical protein
MSCTTTRRIDAQLEAAEARWGRQQCRTWTTVADSSDSLDGTYLDLNVIGYDFAEDQYYLWFNTSGGSAVDPAISGKTAIEVSLTTDDTAAAVASAIVSAINTADIPIIVSASGAVVTLTNQVQGAITAETDSGSTGFSLEVGTVGLSVELGGTDGSIGLALNTESQIIQSNQTGSLAGSEVYLGSSAEITMSLIEVTKERFDTLVGEVTGDSVTPSGGTKVAGFGESRLYQALDSLGGQLILHPIRLADSDKSSDVIFWNCAPKPSSLNFDGTAPQALEVSFTAYLDRSMNTAINLFSRGDWTQKGLTA